MAEYNIESITLPPLAANSDISGWFELLEPIGFTKVYYNDTLQTNKMRWKNTSFGIYCNGVQLYFAKLKSDNTILQISTGLATNLTSTSMTHKIFYRYIRNTNNILFGVANKSNSNPQQTLCASVMEPEDGDDNVWSAYYNGYYIDENMATYLVMGGGSSLSYNSPPATAVALIPFWFEDRFKEKVFYVPVFPLIPVGSVFKTMIGDKIYLINDWCRSSQYTAIAFDITEEFE